MVMLNIEVDLRTKILDENLDGFPCDIKNWEKFIHWYIFKQHNKFITY